MPNVNETFGVMGYVDEDGNQNIHYPITEAEVVLYKNADSQLEAENVQEAIDELAGNVDGMKTITGTEDPTTATVGKVGQHYINTTTPKEFTCLAADTEHGVYTWAAGGGGGGSTLTLDSIKIKTQPSKTAYKAGEYFDPTGMEVVADYSIGGVVVAKDQPVTGYTYPTAALAAGTKKATITYAQGGVRKSADVTIAVTKTSVAVPSFTGAPTYDGTQKTATFSNDPGALATVTGNTGTDAGGYTAHFDLVNTDLYEWADAQFDGDVAWSIGQADTTLTVSPASVTLDADHLTASVAITTDGDGALSAETSAAGVATASVENRTVTISHVNQTTGTATITVRQAAGKNYKAASATIAVDASFFSAVLNVTAVAGAVVTAVSGSNSYQATAGSNGVASLTIGKSGTYTVSGSYQDAASNSANVAVTSNGGTYSATISWITLALTAPSGSNFTLTNGTKTFTGSGTGAAQTFYLPATGTWTASATDGEDTASGSVTVSAYTAYSLTLAFVNIFGNVYDWNNTSTALSRLTAANDPNGLVTVDIATEPVAAVGTGTGSSPFDAYLPWSGMYECNHNGSAVTYRKGESGFSRTANDTVIWIPEYYVKVINDVSNKKTYYYLADGAVSGFTKMAGSGKFVGRYETISGHYSKSGAKPLVSTDRPTFRTQAKAKGGKWRMNDYATWCAYTYLYLIEYADWDSQTTIGKGISNDSATHNTGETDSMVYHTGSAGDKTTGKIAVQYRGIENPFGNVREWVDGANFSERKAYICSDPSKYADDTSTDYTDTGITLCESGWIKSVTPCASVGWAYFFPTANGGSETTCVPDYVYSNTGWRGPIVGGSYSHGTTAGFWCFSAGNAASSTYSNLGSRLLVDP